MRIPISFYSTVTKQFRPAMMFAGLRHYSQGEEGMKIVGRYSGIFAACWLLAGPGLAQPPQTHGDTPPPAPPSGSVVTKAITANVTVSDAMLRDADRDQNNWLLHGRTYDNQRFSP